MKISTSTQVPSFPIVSFCIIEMSQADSEGNKIVSTKASTSTEKEYKKQGASKMTTVVLPT